MTRAVRAWVGTALALSLVLAAACAPKRPPATLPQPEPERYLETGIASWYGKKFHGRTTASGEPFDMHALTAAHPTFPFGTVVRVTNLENGRSVAVRINDRGPFRVGRVIDLSRAAAAELGMIERGIARVGIIVLGD